MSKLINSYPSLFSFGHKAVVELLATEVIVEEKVDGSQISFSIVNGQLSIRSKNAEVNLEDPGMFNNAVTSIRSIEHLLNANYTYRGEYLSKPKHNTLAYERHPEKHVILFDIQRGLEDYLNPEEKAEEAKRLSLEVVPFLFKGKVDSAEQLLAFLDSTSILGGQKIEGVVLKPYSYNLYGQDKKVLMAKYVSEAFKEVHSGEWKKANHNTNDIISVIIAKYKTPARWNKGIQHLKEAGQLTNTPKDIGILMKEVPDDVRKECENEIKDILFAHAWGNIKRGLIAGLPEHYKQQLVESSFEVKNER